MSNVEKNATKNEECGAVRSHLQQPPGSMMMFLRDIKESFKAAVQPSPAVANCGSWRTLIPYTHGGISIFLP